MSRSGHPPPAGGPSYRRAKSAVASPAVVQAYKHGKIMMIRCRFDSTGARRAGSDMDPQHRCAIANLAGKLR